MKHDASIARIHEFEDLRLVCCGANDEIFQCNAPILAGAHPHSLYCYLLRRETHRDYETLAINLLDLMDKGFNPDYGIADNGQGLRKGHKEALPGVPMRGDHYHVLKTLGDLKRHLTNKCKHTETAVIMAAEAEEPVEEISSALDNYEHVKKTMNILIGWLRMDVLRVAGPNPNDRSMLYDFIVSEIEDVEHRYPERLGPIKRALLRQKAQLLSFVEAMSNSIDAIAKDYKVSTDVCWQMCEMLRYKPGREKQVKIELGIRKTLRNKYYHLLKDISQLVEKTIRTSSCIENYNSRIRPYFVLRKQVDQSFLDRLRFFLNHSPFLDSSIPERRGKTPAQLLFKKDHPCWLEMLGYTLFKRSA